MKNILLAVFSFVLIALILTIFSESNNGFNFEDENVSSTIDLTKSSLLAAFLITGILFGHLYRVLSEHGDGMHLNMALIKESFLRITLWKSFLGSPIVFGVIYVVAKDQPDLVVSSILAFENGFICNVILEKRLNDIQEEGSNN